MGEKVREKIPACGIGPGGGKTGRKYRVRGEIREEAAERRKKVGLARGREILHSGSIETI
jgi:hypothetical protein